MNGTEKGGIATQTQYNATISGNVGPYGGLLERVVAIVLHSPDIDQALGALDKGQLDGFCVSGMIGKGFGTVDWNFGDAATNNQNRGTTERTVTPGHSP